MASDTAAFLFSKPTKRLVEGGNTPHHTRKVSSPDDLGIGPDR